MLFLDDGMQQRVEYYQQTIDHKEHSLYYL